MNHPNKKTDTIFTLLGGHLKINRQLQNPSEESLWLAASIEIKPNQRLMDAGCGSGVVGFAIILREPSLKLTTMDIQTNCLSQTSKNAILNNIKCQTVEGDFCNPPFPKNSFDHVVANLPFHAEERGHTTPYKSKKMAHTLPSNSLALWLNGHWGPVQKEGALQIWLHSAEEKELLHWLTKNSLKGSFIYLHSHPNKPPKRFICHISSTIKQKKSVIIPTFAKEWRERILTTPTNLWNNNP